MKKIILLALLFLFVSEISLFAITKNEYYTYIQSEHAITIGYLIYMGESRENSYAIFTNTFFKYLKNNGRSFSSLTITELSQFDVSVYKALGGKSYEY